MSKIKCPTCEKAAEATISFIDEKEILDVMWECDCNIFKKNISKHEKIANIVAFFSIMFGEDNAAWQSFMKLHPNYIIEKFERYVLSMSIEYPWGLHPSLRNYRFNDYVDTWKLQLKDEEELERSQFS